MFEVCFLTIILFFPPCHFPGLALLFYLLFIAAMSGSYGVKQSFAPNKKAIVLNILIILAVVISIRCRVLMPSHTFEPYMGKYIISYFAILLIMIPLNMLFYIRVYDRGTIFAVPKLAVVALLIGVTIFVYWFCRMSVSQNLIGDRQIARIEYNGWVEGRKYDGEFGVKDKEIINHICNYFSNCVQISGYDFFYMKELQLELFDDTGDTVGKFSFYGRGNTFIDTTTSRHFFLFNNGNNREFLSDLRWFVQNQELEEAVRAKR